MRSGQPEHIVVTFYNVAPGVERLDRVDVSMGLAAQCAEHHFDA